MKTCQYCNKSFDRISPKAIYCSESCGKKMRWHKDKDRLNEKRKVPIIKRSCLCCCKEFESRNSKRKYCGSICNQRMGRARKGIISYTALFQKKCTKCNQTFFSSTKHHPISCSKCLNKTKTRNCLYCLEEFESIQKTNKYCSRKCNIKYRSEYGNTRINRKKYRDNNKDKIRVYRKMRYDTDLEFRLKKLLKMHIKRCINKKLPTSKYMRMFGYDLGQLIKHLESTYRNNYNTDFVIEELDYNIHVDHVRPLSSFKFINDDGSTNFESLKEAFSLDNLQLLTAKDNMSKGSKW